MARGVLPGAVGVPTRNRASAFGTGCDGLDVNLWRTEEDFYVGDGEGLSGSREEHRQRHRGMKFHGTLRNTGAGQPWP